MSTNLKSLKAANAARAMGRQSIAVDNISRYHPRGDLVLLEMEVEEYTAGGIAVPRTVAPSVPVARVLEIGPEVKDVTVGQLVLFAPAAGVAIDSRHWLIEAKKIACNVDEPSRLAKV